MIIAMVQGCALTKATGNRVQNPGTECGSNQNDPVYRFTF
jgi:hypothetical protein